MYVCLSVCMYVCMYIYIHEIILCMCVNYLFIGLFIYCSIYSPSSVQLGVLNAFLRCPPWSWMVCPPSRGSCLPLSPIVPLLVSLCWMVLLPFVGWRVRLPKALSGLSPRLSSFLLPFVGWCVRLPSRGLVSPCLPSCFPLLDGAPAFPRVLSPLVSLLVSLCCMVCPPSRGSDLPLSPTVSLLVSLCWMVCPPSRGSCLRLSPIVSLLVSLCYMVRPPSRGSYLPLSPTVSLVVSLCWMACPPSPGSCLPLSPIVYPFLFPFVGSSVGLKTRTFLEELLIGTARFCASFTTYLRVSWGWGGVGWGRVGWGGANNVPWHLTCCYACKCG